MNRLRTIWFYRPWHTVRAIYSEDQVVRAEWTMPVAGCVFFGCLLLFLRALTNLTGYRRAKGEFTMVDARRKHVWVGCTTPSTADFPPEGYCYCERCGLEQTDTERDDTPCEL